MSYPIAFTHAAEVSTAAAGLSREDVERVAREELGPIFEDMEGRIQDLFFHVFDLGDRDRQFIAMGDGVSGIKIDVCVYRERTIDLPEGHPLGSGTKHVMIPEAFSDTDDE